MNTKISRYLNKVQDYCEKVTLVFPCFQGALGLPGGVGQPGLVGEKVGKDGQNFIDVLPMQMY